MLDDIWWIEDFWRVERKLLDNCNHFINSFQLRWEFSADQINTLRNRLLFAGRNIKSLAQVQRDIMSFSDYLRSKPLTESQRKNMNEGFQQTNFYECVKATWITEKDIYVWACIMLKEALDILNDKDLQDISTVTEWVQQHVQKLLQTRWN